MSVRIINESKVFGLMSRVGRRGRRRKGDKETKDKSVRGRTRSRRRDKRDLGTGHPGNEGGG